MCAPDYYTAEVPNNVWMDELDDRKVDNPRAAAQWTGVYDILASVGLVYLIPPSKGLQDQVFTGNAGVAIGDTVVVSSHGTTPRKEETPAATRFFNQFSGLRVVIASGGFFEGEADLKHLHDNVWAGGYGQRSSPHVYDWLVDNLGIDIIKLKQRDPYLYHLDGTVFPLTTEDTLVCTSQFTKREMARLGKVTNIIDVTEAEAYAGITNSVRAGHLVVNGSHIHELRGGTDEYRDEVAKNRRLEDLCADHDLEPIFLNISEFHKAGALLSCLAMRLA